MENRKVLNKIISFGAPLAVVFGAAFLRVLPHPPNFAPIAALALFGGVYLPKKLALVLPILAMILSDIFLGFHDTIVFVYLSFLATIAIGFWLKKKKNFKNILFASLGSSVLFFLVTNFGVWLVSGMYSKDLSGLINSYFLALPFFRNTILGDIVYTGIFFGGYELVKSLSVKFSHSFNR